MNCREITKERKSAEKKKYIKNNINFLFFINILFFYFPTRMGSARLPLKFWPYILHGLSTWHNRIVKVENYFLRSILQRAKRETTSRTRRSEDRLIKVTFHKDNVSVTMIHRVARPILWYGPERLCYNFWLFFINYNNFINNCKLIKNNTQI